MPGSGTHEQFDLIVVGGGPGGSSLATMVAMAGHRVLLLEKEKFPRYQIGESLLPATVHGICNILGVRDELRRANFPRKLGGTFRWGKSEEPWTFAFSSSSVLADPKGYAFQVERAKFDDILLKNAARKGVDVREQHTVLDFIKEGERVTGVRFTDAGGQERTATARYVADASGNATRLAPLVGERIYSKFFQNVSLFGYFENGKRLPPPGSGNLITAAFEGGWFWYLPLSQTLTSVGVVVAREQASRLQGDPDAAMRALIDECPLIKDYLANARRVTEGMYGKYRVRKDYSYCHTRFWSPGAVLVGDAACFIDPVFSSGVHLATYAALQAARSINTCLAGQLDEASCFNEFEQRYRREYGNFYQFLISFYDMNRELDSYFWEARTVLKTEERSNEAFVRLVAGVSDASEPAFQTAAEEYFEKREGMSELYQRSFEGKPVDDLVSSWPEDKRREFGGTLNTLTEEIHRVQSQAQLGDKRAEEQPLFEGGLVPSAGGLTWTRPRVAAA